QSYSLLNSKCQWPLATTSASSVAKGACPCTRIEAPARKSSSGRDRRIVRPGWNLFNNRTRILGVRCEWVNRDSVNDPAGGEQKAIPPRHRKLRGLTYTAQSH